MAINRTHQGFAQTVPRTPRLAPPAGACRPPRLTCLIGILACSAICVVSGCHRSGYEVQRPWANQTNAPLELVTLDHRTRPCRRVHADPETLIHLPLGSVEAGVLTTDVGMESPSASAGSVDLWLRDASASGWSADRAADCRIPLGGEGGLFVWKECRITIERAMANAALAVRLQGPVSADLLVASPVLTARPRPPRPLVFVFLMDTVRADRLVTFNPTIPLGAALDRFAHDAIVFERARSSSSWTRTAVATLLTGLWATTHKVLDRSDVLPAEWETLPEILQQHGYQTIAWSSNPNILPLWGFARGFDAFVDVGAFEWARNKTDDAVVLRLAQDAVEQHKTEPFFYYVHLMDAHAPYRPDAAHLAQVQNEPRLAASFPGTASGPNAAVAAENYPKYLASIMQMDEALGAFFDSLKREGVYDQSLILVAADHGEEFLDHGDIYHGKTLYEEMLHVPVLLKLPGGVAAGTRVSQAVTLADLMPTVLQALGIPIPAHLDGDNVLVEPRKDAATRVQTATLKLDDRHLDAVVQIPWKLILDHHGGESLFNLERDAREQVSLIDADAHRANQMGGVLDALMATRAQGWHLRGCAGAQQAALRFVIMTHGAKVEPSLFEADDSISPAPVGDEVTATMNLGPRPVTQEVLGRLVEKIVRDEDEIVIPTDGSGRTDLVVRSVDGPISYALGTRTEQQSGAVISVDSQSEMVTVRGSEPVNCFDNGPEARRDDLPYLRISFVPPPERVPEKGLDPAVEERLRALGY